MKIKVSDVNAVSSLIDTAISNAGRLLAQQQECIANYKNTIQAEYNSKSIIYKFFFDISYDKDTYGFRASLLPNNIFKLSKIQGAIEISKEINADVVLDNKEINLISTYAGLAEHDMQTLMNKEKEFWCNKV